MIGNPNIVARPVFMPYHARVKFDERFFTLFQPDVLLQAQYYDRLRRKFCLEPEKRLMMAVLDDAIVCFQKYLLARDSRGKKLFREAEEWILGEDSEWVFSFENICEVLELDPRYVRQGLLGWKEKRLARRVKTKVTEKSSAHDRKLYN